MTRASLFNIDDNERMLVVSRRDNLQESFDFLMSPERDSFMYPASERYRRVLVIMPGTYRGGLIINKDYCDVREFQPGTVSVPDGITNTTTTSTSTIGAVGSGYTITGNTLTVTSVGGAGDRFATLADVISYWFADSSMSNRKTIILPAGIMTVHEPLVIDKPYCTIKGQGKGITILQGALEGSVVSATSSVTDFLYASGAIVEDSAIGTVLSGFTIHNTLPDSSDPEKRAICFATKVTNTTETTATTTSDGTIVFSGGDYAGNIGDRIYVVDIESWVTITGSFMQGVFITDKFVSATTDSAIKVAIGNKYNDLDFIADDTNALTTVSAGIETGVWTNCSATGSYAFSIENDGDHHAKMFNCEAYGVKPFFGDASGAKASGDYKLCKAGNMAFGGCFQYGIDITIDARFELCSAGYYSFGLGKVCAGTFINCKGLGNCFGGYAFGTYYSTFSGYAKGCVAGNNSFGAGNANCVNSGEMEECVVSGLSTPIYCTGATIRNSKITVTTTGKDCLVLNDSNSKITHSELKVVQGGTGIPVNAGSALNVVVAQCTMNNATNDADGLGANVTNLVTTPNNVVDDNI